MERLWVLVVLLGFAARALCSPVESRETAYKRSAGKEEKRTILSKEENVLEYIEKNNKGSDRNLFEADIVLNPDDNVDNSNSGDVDGKQLSVRRKRNAARDRKKLWINRVIPYEFDSKLPVSFQPTIQEAIDEFENRTCLTFVKRTNEDLFIRFVHEVGCWSGVGRQYWMSGVGQKLSLGPGCNHKGTIMHELMHAVGFWHEQSRPDRNDYVEVLWENIQKNEEHNFNKYSRHDIDVLQVPYDYESIMHYGRKSFSKNGLETIRPIQEPQITLGQRDDFTDFDVHEINALYDCANQAGGWSSWSQFGPCSVACYKYRQRFCTSSNPSIDCPGADSYGVEKGIEKCNKSECYAPIDGHWGRWAAWGACDSPCGLGSQSRTRSCDDPLPRYGGKSCAGEIKSTQTCKLRSCGIGPDDCEFDSDFFCHWGNDPKNPPAFNWERNAGSTPSSNTGPSGDHTSGSGNYIFVETSGIDEGEKARLLSRAFQATTGRCLTFWYDMFGSGVGELNVYVKPVTGSMTSVWSLSGDQGDEWKMARVTLISASEYQVIFEAVRGSSFRADIALDDISFQETPCFEAIGCYNDRPSRALPDLVKNLRPWIDWYKIGKTVDNCAKLAQERNNKIFGIQFYGECWGDDTGVDDYDKYGIASPDRCWNGVGKHWTNYVYKII